MVVKNAPFQKYIINTPKGEKHKEEIR